MPELAEAYASGMSPERYEELLAEHRDVHRLHRRRAEFSAQDEALLRGLPAQRALVITEPWCGDSLAILPVVLELFARIPGSVVRIVLRDENQELMDGFLTRGGRAVPIVVALGEDDGERFRWGPRPGPAQAILEANWAGLAAGTVARATIFAQIRAFYAKDRGRTIIAELLERLREGGSA
ncbi:MAG: thioredoxin family protein [Candidatus Bipolaricaulota bacterium]|nr:MAG: thioredoxin family protein [Candidatus Bipolaricaulota bacterium]